MKKISSIQEAEDYIYGYDFFGNLDQAKDTLLPVLKVCEALAVQHNRAALLCRTRTYLIYLFIEFNQLDLATELAAINLNVAREQQLEDGLLYMVAIIAHLYQLTGNYSASEELVEIVQDRIPGMQDDKKVCKMYMMVADQYFFTSDRKRCLEAAAQSARYARRTDDLALKAVCMNNYAEKLLQYRELEQAADILAEGRAYAAASGNGSMLALLNGNYGYYFLLREAYEDASEYLLAAIRFYQEHEAVNKEMLFTIDLVRAYFRTGRFAEGYEWLTRLEAIAISSTANRILLDTYALLVDYHEQGGDFRAALENLKKQNAVYAIIKNEESEEKIRNLQITHEVKTIQQERDNAAKLARIKHDFLANMSHVSARLSTRS